MSEAASLWTTPFTEFLDACICVTEGKREEAVHKLTLFLKNHVDLKNSSDKDTYADAQDELGRLLFDLERYADGIEPLEEALILAEGEQCKRLSFYLGVCHRRTGNVTVSEQMLIQSLPADQRDPWWVQAQYQLGCLYFQRGAYLDAKRAFELSECFMDEADADLKKNVSGWISKTRAKLGQSEKQEISDAQRIILCK